MGQDRYDRAAAAIMARSALAQGTIADQGGGEAAATLGLARTAALLDRLGRPQGAQPLVHVAGSKGKGSTAAMVAAILPAAGYRTGRATSPHLHRLTERTTIDGRDLDGDTFADLAGEVLTACDALESADPGLGRVNAYEALLSLSLLAFRRDGCEVAVVEVGLGGRLDASNVIDPAVSVITTLDLEHTAILGETLPEIAAEKAGIIKPGRPVVSAPQPEDALRVIRARAAALGSPLTVISTADRDAIPLGATPRLPGPHQRWNAAVAIATVRALASIAGGIQVHEPAIRAGLAAAWLPGRFEVVDPPVVARLLGDAAAAPPVVLDGAHTPRSAAALRDALAASFPGRASVIAVIGMAGDKAARDVLGALAPGAIVPVAVRSPRAMPVGELAGIAGQVGIPVLAPGDGRDPADLGGALRAAVEAAGADGAVMVTGSFAVVAAAREALGMSGIDR